MERETDRKRREELLHRIQRMLHERVRFAAIYDYIWPSGWDRGSRMRR